jgi:lipopolysaccharide export system permease protein
MLTHIDRYIVNRFCRVLFVALLSFIAIYVVVDLIDHLDDFLQQSARPADVARYYLNYIPYIVVLTLPIGTLLSTLFVIGEMGSANELVAIKAAGISMYRVAWPLLRLGLIISAISLLLGELVVPQANDVRREILDLRSAAATETHLRHITRQDRAGYVLYAGYYNSEDMRASNVTIVQFRDDRAHRRIDATEMAWDDQGWMLTNATDRIYSEGRQVLTEHLHMRLPTLTLRPADLARQFREPDQMPYLELRDYIAQVRESGGDASRWLVDLHLKIAFPLSSVMMIWLGFPIAARSWRGGKAMYIGWTLLIGFLFFVTVRAGQAMGRAGSVSPVVGAWSAAVLFLVLGALLFHWTRK